MKFIFTIFIIVYFTLIGQSQFERPPMPYQQVKLIGENENDTIPYLWYETDSVPEWNSMYNNAYNKIDGYRRILLQDSFIYMVYPKREYFKNEFLEGHLLNGIFIVKRNIYTGELIWNTHYSDVEAGRQETLINCRLNDKNNIEIIGYRRARTTESNNFQFGAFGMNDRDLRLFFREYDGKTGKLLKHQFPDSTDTNAVVLREQIPTQFTKLFFTPNDTTIRYFETLVAHPGPKGIITFLLNRNGKRISKIDTVSTDVTQNNSHVFLTKENRYVVLINNIYASEKILLYFYDLDMNLLKTKEVSVKTNKGSLFVNSFKDSEYMELHISNNNTPPDYHTETFTLFLNKEGDVIDSVYTKFPLSSFIYTKDQNLLINYVVWDEMAENYKNVFLFKPYNEPIRTFKSFLPNSKYYFSTIGLENIGDYFLFHNLEKHLDYLQYKAASLMLVRVEDFGLTLSSNKDELQAIDWAIYPNPCTDYFDITFSDDQSGQIKIFDVTGRLVFASEKPSGATYLSVESQSWQPGLYFVQFVTDKGAFSTKKIVKN